MDFFVHSTALASLAVVAVQQILKLKFIPWGFVNRHPVPGLILLSAAASAIVVWTNRLATPVAWTDWLLLGATIAVVAAIVYNNTLKNWGALRAMEGEGDVKV